MSPDQDMQTCCLRARFQTSEYTDGAESISIHPEAEGFRLVGVSVHYYMQDLLCMTLSRQRSAAPWLRFNVDIWRG